jgi:hypothetical protein
MIMSTNSRIRELKKAIRDMRYNERDVLRQIRYCLKDREYPALAVNVVRAERWKALGEEFERELRELKP